MASQRRPAHEVDPLTQIGNYLYHGTDSETAKVIQREGMNTGESMEMSTHREPRKRLWFGLNPDLAHSFGDRRIYSLAEKEMWKRMVEKFGTDFGRDGQNINPLEWEGPPGTPMPFEEFQTEEAINYYADWDETRFEGEIDIWDRHVVVLRVKESNIPKDCIRDEYRLREGFIVQDDCTIPPELFEVCSLGSPEWPANPYNTKNKWRKAGRPRPSSDAAKELREKWDEEILLTLGNYTKPHDI